MTLVQLRHLIALAECASFSRAAEAVHLTQPALSRSIRALEDELGQPLFDRVGRRAELTPFGTEVLQRARHLVFDAEQLAASARLTRDGATGTVRVGLGSGPGALLAVPLLRTMALKHKGLRLEIARGPTDRLLQALRERHLDMLVLDLRSVPPAGDLVVDDVFELPGAYLCRPGHPLTRRRGPIPYRALQAYPLASTPLSDEVARVLVERYGPEAHPAQAVTLRSDELRSLVRVARESDAVLLAIRAAAPELVELTLKPALNATARLGTVVLAGRAQAPALPLVRRLVQQVLGSA